MEQYKKYKRVFKEGNFDDYKILKLYNLYGVSTSHNYQIGSFYNKVDCKTVFNILKDIPNNMFKSYKIEETYQLISDDVIKDLQSKKIKIEFKK